MAKTDLPLSMLLPGEEGWELWKRGKDGRLTMARRFEGAMPEKNARVDLVGLPVTMLGVLPVWLVQTQDGDVESRILLQMEKRGILAGGSEGPLAYIPVGEREGELLYFAVALLNGSGAEGLLEMGERRDAAIRFCTYPPNSLAFRKELGRDVMVVMREREPVYFQALSTQGVEQVLEVECVLLQLATENILGELDHVCVAGEGLRPLAEEVARRQELPLLQLPPCEPVIPRPEWNLTPAQIKLAGERRRAALQKWRWAAVALAVYLVCVAGLTIHTWWMKSRVKEMARTTEALKPRVEGVKKAINRWQEIAPSVNPRAFSVEQLRLIHSHIVPGTVRLVAFEVHEGHIRLRGEAASAPAAFDFSQALKNDAGLSGYDWEMEQPKILPNNSAQFVLEGYLRDEIE